MKTEISINTLKEAVYNLCVQANICYPQDLYDLVYKKYCGACDFYEKNKLHNILKNIELSNSLKRPLCQDTGQVIVFLEIGTDVKIDGDINNAINDAVASAYTENYFRKSVVRNAIFDRSNTENNTPAVIYTDFVNSDELSVKLLIKGAGSENYSAVKMFTPSSDKKDIFEFIKLNIESAGEKACPPYVLGIGAGGTMDYASVLSKKAFFEDRHTDDEIIFIEELKSFLFENGFDENILDVKIKTSSTHIACMPVALTINCHSTRHAQCKISSNKVVYNQTSLSIRNIVSDNIDLKEVYTSDIASLRDIKKGETVLLSGEIYTARDAAHARMFELDNQNRSLSIDLKNKIIFYAGPCPASPNESIGPVGPTTSARMDKFTEFIYGNGIFATIGKGERSKDAENLIRKYNGRYFTVQGGIACLISKCVESSEVVAFDDLGTEAIRKLTIKRLPITVEL